MKTFSAKAETVTRNWYVVDAAGQCLGRLAAQIALRLRGKHKPIYTPHVDTGDFVVVTNVEQVSLSGKKLEKKRYYRHSGYVGHLKVMTCLEMKQKRPEKLLELAVKGMLPKGSLGRQMFKKLKVYSGPEHPHASQRPKSMRLLNERTGEQL